jgi:hypothetical protein
MSSSVGWLVLAGLFLAELAALAGLFVWGLATQGWLLGLAAAGVAAVLWGLFAAPKARFPHPAGRAVVKVAVFGSAVAGLWAVGHHGWALALACFVVALQLLSLLPSVRSVDPREY